MKKIVPAPVLLKVSVYMHPDDRKKLRLLAARADMTMSAYLKHLLDQQGPTS